MTRLMANRVAFAITVTLAGATGPSYAAGDAAAGKAIYARCAICHTLTPGAPKLGPHLGKIVGRKAASVAGFAYSPAMKASNIVWTREAIDKYLTNPRAMVPGTKMAFGGMSKPQDRANVIAYMEAATK
jgi:cytochrome c